MENLFALFYAVIFGGLLSAEIGNGHFKIAKIRENEIQSVLDKLCIRSQTLAKWLAWAWRGIFLVFFRSAFFACWYVSLSDHKIPGGSKAFWSVLALLLLCLPVLGFQQLSYLLVYPPDESQRDKSWLVLGIASFAIVLVLYFFHLP